MNKIAAINIRVLNVAYYTYLIHTAFIFKQLLLCFMDVFSWGINCVRFTQVVFAQSKLIIYSSHMDINLHFKCSFFNHISLGLKPIHILLSLISPRSRGFLFSEGKLM